MSEPVTSPRRAPAVHRARVALAKRLHNMSAPPRMTVNVRALVPEQCPPTERYARVAASATALRTVVHVDLDRLLASHLRGYRTCCPGTPSQTAARLQANRIKDREPYLRTRCVVALSRLAVGKITRLNLAAVMALAGMSEEALDDEYLENTAALEPLALGLPSFAFVHPGQKLGATTDIHIALAVLSRAATGFFIASHDPYLHNWEKLRPIRLALRVPVASDAGLAP